VPLFYRNQPVELKLKRRDLTGLLIYEKSKELAVRIPQSEFDRDPAARNAFEEFRDQLRDLVKPDMVKISYRQGRYLCEGEARALNLEPDRSCAEGSFVLNLEMPPRIRRSLNVNDGAAAAAGTP
jgi:hypothetical protein